MGWKLGCFYEHVLPSILRLLQNTKSEIVYQQQQQHNDVHFYDETFLFRLHFAASNCYVKAISLTE